MSSGSWDETCTVSGKTRTSRSAPPSSCGRNRVSSRTGNRTSGTSAPASETSAASVVAAHKGGPRVVERVLGAAQRQARVLERRLGRVALGLRLGHRGRAAAALGRRQRVLGVARGDPRGDEPRGRPVAGLGRRREFRVRGRQQVGPRLPGRGDALARGGDRGAQLVGACLRGGQRAAVEVERGLHLGDLLGERGDVALGHGTAASAAATCAVTAATFGARGRSPTLGRGELALQRGDLLALLADALQQDRVGLRRRPTAAVVVRRQPQRQAAAARPAGRAGPGALDCASSIRWPSDRDLGVGARDPGLCGAASAVPTVRAGGGRCVRARAGGGQRRLQVGGAPRQDDQLAPQPPQVGARGGELVGDSARASASTACAASRAAAIAPRSVIPHRLPRAAAAVAWIATRNGFCSVSIARFAASLPHAACSAAAPAGSGLVEVEAAPTA